MIRTLVLRQIFGLIFGLCFFSLTTAAIAGPNRVVVGQPNLKRTGWSGFKAAGVGTVLENGDLLSASQNAAISCGGARPSPLVPGKIVGVANLCGNNTRRLSGLRGNSADDTPIPGGNNAEIPYLISPRHTWLAQSDFLIRWNQRPDAQTYYVNVFCKGEDCPQSLIWEASTKQSEIRYAGPPLLAGNKYQVVIETDNDLSSQMDQGANNSTFEIYDPSQTDRMGNARQEVAALELTGEAQTLALADRYVNFDLYYDAVNLLENQIQQGTTVVPVYQMLARLYGQIGLNLKAQETYKQAIALAESQQDLDAIALSKKGLGKIETVMGQPETAKTLFQQAIAAYTELGDQKQAERLQYDLDHLNILTAKNAPSISK